MWDALLFVFLSLAVYWKRKRDTKNNNAVFNS